MVTGLTEADLLEAIENCASEPIHIPGSVQPFGALLGVSRETGDIEYASENIELILGQTADQLLGTSFKKQLGRDLWHDIKNALAEGGLDMRSISLGEHEISGRRVECRVCESGPFLVVEFETSKAKDLAATSNLATISRLMLRMQSCKTKAELFELVVGLLRHLTGYDRVSLHKFDRDWNGEVLAEAKRAALDTWVGLHFPAQDYPRQAREIMQRIPFRFIQDVDQTPVKICAKDAAAQPLDISLAACRGVSPIHMQYLRNMGIAASLTLSVVVEDRLWGLITFHSHAPYVPSPELRDILTNFLPLFTTKLQTLEQAEHIAAIDRINALSESTASRVNTVSDLQDALENIGPTVVEVLDAAGVAVMLGSQSNCVGVVPDQEVLEVLRIRREEEDEDIIAIEDLLQQYPQFADQLNGSAGVLIAKVDNHRSMLVFRRDVSQTLSWAGNPEKTIEKHNGNLRLQPRGSFSAFLETVSGRSRKWTDEDIYFMRRFLPVISTAERKVVMMILQRQQKLMISELSHRVRNILALVRSVSRQAQRSFGSLQSYSRALEERIQSLANAHDLTSHSMDMAVSLRALILRELEPYTEVGKERILVDGTNGFLRPDTAPVFSLVIHELATNCVKYGALSGEKGRLEIAMHKSDQGLTIEWREIDGPPVKEPEEKGFGSALIEQAMAHELDGTSELLFHPDGVRAEIFLPAKQLQTGPSRQGHNSKAAFATMESVPFRAKDVSGTVMLLEDNYVIAKDTADIMRTLGFDQVDILANADEALDYLEGTTPLFAILDVNLGRNRTSEEVAVLLQSRGVPFLFSTGFGEVRMVHQNLSEVPVVKKPLIVMELEHELHQLFPSEADV